MKLSPLPEATFLPPNLSQFLSPPSLRVFRCPRMDTAFLFLFKGSPPPPSCARWGPTSRPVWPPTPTTRTGRPASSPGTPASGRRRGRRPRRCRCQTLSVSSIVDCDSRVFVPLKTYHKFATFDTVLIKKCNMASSPTQKWLRTLCSFGPTGFESFLMRNILSGLVCR